MQEKSKITYSQYSQKHIITKQIKRIKDSLIYWTISCSVVFLIFFIMSNVS